MTVKIAYTVIGLATMVVLARTLGPGGYGLYAFALSVIVILAIPVQLGLPTLLVREVSKYDLNHEWALLRGILARANQSVFLISIVAIIFVGLIVWFVHGRSGRVEFATFAWALALLPLIALGNVRAAALRGLGRVVRGQLPEFLLTPAFLLLLVLGTLALGTIVPHQVMALHVLAASASFTIGTLLLMRALPQEVRTAEAAYQTANWLRSGAALSLVAGIEVVNSQTNIILLGILSESSDVGLYRVAAQGAGLVAFTLNAVCIAVSPHISRLHHAGELARLQRIITISARFVLATALPVAVVLAVFGEWILMVVFGEAYRPGYEALRILCLGQLVHAAAGPVAFLLNMTGHERDTVRGMSLAAVVNVALGAALIPTLGLTGAAIANASTYFLWNVILWRAVGAKLGIDSTAIGPALLRFYRA